MRLQAIDQILPQRRARQPDATRYVTTLLQQADRRLGQNHRGRAVAWILLPVDGAAHLCSVLVDAYENEVVEAGLTLLLRRPLAGFWPARRIRQRKIRGSSGGDDRHLVVDEVGAPGMALQHVR